MTRQDKERVKPEMGSKIARRSIMNDHGFNTLDSMESIGSNGMLMNSIEFYGRILFALRVIPPAHPSPGCHLWQVARYSLLGSWIPQVSVKCAIRTLPLKPIFTLVSESFC